MTPLHGPDKTHLDAAEGWLELGNHLEANEELDRIAPENRAHPAVLELRWQIHALAKNWNMCFDIANAICDVEPDNPSGWLKLAESLHGRKHTDQAADLLFVCRKDFPNEAELFYNLARYECNLGNLADAVKWLEKAVALKDTLEMNRRALQDPDFERMWAEIGKF